MLATVFPARMAHAQLEDARESLEYWRDRADRLPRHAVRRRREAREMARRWEHRVVEAERARYGAGLLGALVLLAAERRLPAHVHSRTRMVARRGAQAATVVLVAVVALVLAVGVAAVELIAEFVNALAG
jgi:hypothetical protein